MVSILIVQHYIRTPYRPNQIEHGWSGGRSCTGICSLIESEINCVIIESMADRHISVCFVFLLVLLAACTIPLQPEVQRRLEDQHRFAKNYVIGESMTVNVGDPIIKFQDFWVETIELAENRRLASSQKRLP